MSTGGAASAGRCATTQIEGGLYGDARGDESQADDAGRNPVGNRPSYSSCRRTSRRPLWGSDQGRSLLDAVQAAEGLSRPAAYAFKGRTLHRDLGDLSYRDG